MRTWARRLITSDYADPDAARRAQTLNALMAAAIPMAIVTALIVLPLQNGPVSAFFLVLTAATLTGLMWWTHAGHLGSAVFGFAAVLFQVTVGQPLATGDLSTNAMLIPLSTVMLVYVFPLRQWYVVAGWVIAALAVLQWGTNDLATVELPRWVWLVNAALATALTVLVVTYAAHQLAQAVRRETALAHQLTAREAVLQRLDELANSDPLTGFLNRRGLHDALSGAGGAFALVDLDHFKAINDDHSHATGDAILVGFSQLVSEIAEPQDLLFRLGGDEFLMVRPHAAAVEVEKWLHILRDRARGHVWEGLPAGQWVSFSAGVVNREDDSVQAAMHRADQALYEAKARGRDAVVVRD